MVLGTGNKCVKYMVFFFNFLVFVIGVGILAGSLVVIFSDKARGDFQGVLDKGKVNVDLSSMNIPLYVLAGVGGLLLLTGFLGCCGACMENTCLLGVFFTIILILFLAELACGIAILVNKDKIRDELFKGMTESVKKYNPTTPDGDLEKTIKGMQDHWNCCGCNGPTDYTVETAARACSPTQLTTGGGCCPKMWDEFESKAKIIGGVAIGILVIELLAMIFSCILCQAFKRGDYQYA